MRWGIIGFGHIARKRFVPGLAAVPGAQLVAVQNRDETRTPLLASEFGCRAYARVQDLVADPEVEAVYIASPPHLHVAEVTAAAAAGKQILLEKPMARNLDDCRAIARVAREAGVTLLLGNMLRFHACNRLARDLVAGGAVGKVVAARADFGFLLREEARSWRLQQAVGGGGPLMDVGVHVIDLLRYVLGAEVEAVQCSARGWAISSPAGGDTEDTAALTLSLSGGIVATSLVSFGTPEMENRLEVFGTEGRLWTEGSIGQEPGGRLFVGRDGRKEEYSPAPVDLYAAEIAHLEECVRTGARPLISALEGARDLAAVLSAAESAATGQAVQPVVPWSGSEA